MIRAGQIDSEALGGQIRRFAADFGRSLYEELKVTARTVALSLARSTQPYGIGLDAKKTGAQAVARDIRRVFVTPRQVFKEIAEIDRGIAGRFWKAVTENNRNQQEWSVRKAGLNLDLQSSLMPETHQSARNHRGRVTRKRPSAMAPAADIQAYTRQIQQRVGTAKGGWSAAAEELGGRGIPKWASGTSHGGHGNAIEDPRDCRVVISTLVPWARDVLPKQEEDYAVAVAADRLYQRIDAIMSADMAKAGLKRAA